MAEYEQNVSKFEEVDATGRGWFDLGGKKEEGEKKPHCQEEAISTEFDEKVKVSEPEHKHGGLREKLHRSDSSSSSSSDEEEVGEGGEKKKKKKGLKEKLSGDDKKEEHKAEGHHHEHEEDTSIPVERYDEPVAHAEPEEKKGTLLDKIKEKLPGNNIKKADQEVAPPPPPPSSTVEYSAAAAEGCEAKEKKGFLDKIKEKLPGFHPKPEEEKEKEKEKEAASHY